MLLCLGDLRGCNRVSAASMNAASSHNDEFDKCKACQFIYATPGDLVVNIVVSSTPNSDTLFQFCQEKRTK